jgi:dienelactone hydrolase
MGVVYRATDEQLRRTIAIKFLPPEFLHDSSRLGRFRNEARALSALNHPQIVTVHEVGQAGDTPFFVMELVEGETLRARMARGPLPLRDGLDIVLQVARGLLAAHDEGLIHRDIKPENVMIRRDGYVKVLDFGIALLREPGSPTQSLTAGSIETVTGGAMGTPAYMSPEQVDGRALDARTDIFSLGVLLCEAVTGRNPFVRPTLVETLSAIQKSPASAESAIAALPADVRAIVLKSLQRDPEGRYQATAGLVADLRLAIANVDDRDRTVTVTIPPPRKRRWDIAATIAIGLVGITSYGVLAYLKSERRHWVREQAVADITRLVDAQQTVQALRLVQKAEGYLPGDPALAKVAVKASRTTTIRSSPPGALVEVEDYQSSPDDWLAIGTTPLEHARVPSGYLRWKVSKSGVGESITAPPTADTMNFDLDAAVHAPDGMVPITAGRWTDSLAFLGWVGPYDLPAYFIDRFEVSNRQYQAFVDAGGYTNQQYWKEPFVDGARTLSWTAAMERLRDTTGRPGPATWTGGHFPEGRADFPVSGISWYEALAYAEFAGKSLPVMAQGYRAQPAALDQYALPLSNLSTSLAARGQYRGLGVYGTYDMIGNAREWYRNGDGTGLRFTLGRAAASYGPEALPPFDRSPLNGVRCVRNSAPVPAEAAAPRPFLHRDFAKAKPADDETFRIYRNMYAYDRSPLDAAVDPARESTEDWTREKITFAAAYGHERMAAYLFLPKHARPPFQTVIFFPSARVNFLPATAPPGDLSFMDYVVQSGRAVMYPVYRGLYERRAAAPTIPGPTLMREQMVAWSKDLARSIDYLATREDIDHARFGYLGVSQGSAYGVILAALEDRLSAVVLLDGGFFQQDRPIPGMDQADFAPRLLKPVLMINGRYDATFPFETAQLPLFRMLGTPAADKRQVIFDTPHDVRLKRADLVKEVLAWYDRYLGRVQ